MIKLHTLKAWDQLHSDINTAANTLLKGHPDSLTDLDGLSKAGAPLCIQCYPDGTHSITYATLEKTRVQLQWPGNHLQSSHETLKLITEVSALNKSIAEFSKCLQNYPALARNAHTQNVYPFTIRLLINTVTPVGNDFDAHFLFQCFFSGGRISTIHKVSTDEDTLAPVRQSIEKRLDILDAFYLDSGRTQFDVENKTIWADTHDNACLLNIAYSDEKSLNNGYNVMFDPGTSWSCDPLPVSPLT
jgi:hypothetical protein